MIESESMDKIDAVYDTEVVIIGGGPAGISSAAALTNKIRDYYLIDSGKSFSDRNHNYKEELGNGIGGAGLFSDGKFSFFPAGSNLYFLHKEFLTVAYIWFQELMSQIGIEVPGFPLNSEASESPLMFESKKRYKSIYADFAQRQLLTRLIAVELGNRTLSETQVINLYKTNNCYEVYCKRKDKTTFLIKAKHAIIATGRCGSIDRLLLSLSMSDSTLFTPKRFDFGVRIEANSDACFFNRNTEADVKYIWGGGSKLEYRTFCTCRNGEVWNIDYGTIKAISGRADGKKSDFSNFGFLVRYSGDSFRRGLSIWEKIKPITENGCVLVERLTNFLQLPARMLSANKAKRPWFPNEDYICTSIKKCIGEDLSVDLTKGLTDLVSMFPDFLEHDTYCLFPAIEGVGYYPKVDKELRLGEEKLWFAGDVVGDFRGLVPAFISGYVAGLSIINYISFER